MKIKVELYGSTKDFSSKNIIEIDLKTNSYIQDLRNKLIQFIDNNHKGNKNFCKIIRYSAFCSEDNIIVHDDYLISKEQKIAIIPPIAGG